MKRGQIRHVCAESLDGFEEESDHNDEGDYREARVDGVDAAKPTRHFKMLNGPTGANCQAARTDFHTDGTSPS